MKKGNKIIRTDPEVHEKLISEAQASGRTINNVLRELLGLSFISEITQKYRSEKLCRKKQRSTRA